MSNMREERIKMERKGKGKEREWKTKYYKSFV